MADPVLDGPVAFDGTRNEAGPDDPLIYGASAGSKATGETRSLIEDLEALVDDARTYIDAELTYQKTRAAFISDRLKKTIIFGVAAAAIAFLAAIGLTVGLIIALTPLITGWGATAVVVIVWLVAAYLLVRKAGEYWRDARREIGSDGNDPSLYNEEG